VTHYHNFKNDSNASDFSYLRFN